MQKTHKELRSILQTLQQTPRLYRCIHSSDAGQFEVSWLLSTSLRSKCSKKRSIIALNRAGQKACTAEDHDNYENYEILKHHFDFKTLQHSDLSSVLPQTTHSYLFLCSLGQLYFKTSLSEKGVIGKVRHLHESTKILVLIIQANTCSPIALFK